MRNFLYEKMIEVLDEYKKNNNFSKIDVPHVPVSYYPMFFVKADDFNDWKKYFQGKLEETISYNFTKKFTELCEKAQKIIDKNQIVKLEMAKSLFPFLKKYTNHNLIENAMIEWNKIILEIEELKILFEKYQKFILNTQKIQNMQLNEFNNFFKEINDEFNKLSKIVDDESNLHIFNRDNLSDIPKLIKSQKEHFDNHFNPMPQKTILEDKLHLSDTISKIVNYYNTYKNNPKNKIKKNEEILLGSIVAHHSEIRELMGIKTKISIDKALQKYFEVEKKKPDNWNYLKNKIIKISDEAVSIIEKQKSNSSNFEEILNEMNI